MNDSYEMEIDLKWLLYRILRGWRPIVTWAIIVGLLVGVSYFSVLMVKWNHPEFIEEQKVIYNRAHAGWEATIENYEAQLANLEEAQQEQKEYNEDSVLMKIDPLRQFRASFEIYVDYDYQIMPDMAYQNIDLSDRILKAYATYMTNGELQQYVIDNLSYSIERRYLSEILSVSVDYGNNMLSVSVTNQSAEACNEMLGLVKTALMAKFEDVKTAIADHNLVTTNETAYEAVNLSLQETQKANRQAVFELDMAKQEVYLEYEDWKLSKEGNEPMPGHSRKIIGIRSIKWLLISGVGSAVVVAAIIAFGALLSGKLLNPEDVKNRFGLRVIGQLPTARVKKPFAFVSRWFAKFGGITAKPEDYDRLAKMIGSGIKAELASREDAAAWKKIAFTGTVSEDELANVVSALGMDPAYSVICAVDVLTNADAIEKLSGADCVVLVEKQEVSTLADITKEIEALRAWNKPVLGAVVVNADAVM